MCVLLCVHMFTCIAHIFLRQRHNSHDFGKLHVIVLYWLPCKCTYHLICSIVRWPLTQKTSWGPWSSCHTLSRHFLYQILVLENPKMCTYYRRHVHKLDSGATIIHKYMQIQTEYQKLIQFNFICNMSWSIYAISIALQHCWIHVWCVKKIHVACGNSFISWAKIAISGHLLLYLGGYVVRVCVTSRVK